MYTDSNNTSTNTSKTGVAPDKWIIGTRLFDHFTSPLFIFSLGVLVKGLTENNVLSTIVASIVLIIYVVGSLDMLKSPVKRLSLKRSLILIGIEVLWFTFVGLHFSWFTASMVVAIVAHSVMIQLMQSVNKGK